MVSDTAGLGTTVGIHYVAWVFFPDLGHQQSTHSSTSATTERVHDLEAY